MQTSSTSDIQEWSVIVTVSYNNQVDQMTVNSKSSDYNQLEVQKSSWNQSYVFTCWNELIVLSSTQTQTQTRDMMWIHLWIVQSWWSCLRLLTQLWCFTLFFLEFVMWDEFTSQLRGIEVFPLISHEAVELHLPSQVWSKTRSMEAYQLHLGDWPLGKEGSRYRRFMTAVA
jgi:hypothetical protein